MTNSNPFINYGESRAVKTKLKTKNIIYNLLRKDDLDSIVAIYKTDMKDLIRVILAQDRANCK